MYNNILDDHITHNIGKPYKKIIFVEDLIETHPEDSEKVMAVYSLYEVTFTDDTTIKLVHVLSNSASAIIEGTPEVLHDIFEQVEYTKEEKNDQTDKV